MFLKRIGAYLIDMTIVILSSSMLASISYINPELKEYNKIYEEYTEAYEELDKKSDVNKEEYSKLTKEYEYKLDQRNEVTVIISILTIIAYFVVFQKYNNGQTLGKKIMKIKIAGNLNIFKYLLRALIAYNIIFNLMKLILIFVFSKENYLLASNILYVGALIVEVTTMILISMRKDHKGLHDLVAGSKVIDLKLKEE